MPRLRDLRLAPARSACAGRGLAIRDQEVSDHSATPSRRRRRIATLIVAEILWALYLLLTYYKVEWLARVKPDVWLYDWNVYHAAATDLVARDLYRVPLIEPGYELPVTIFNYPPLAAAWEVPLLPLGREDGGLAFVLLSLVAVVIGVAMTVRAAGLRPGFIWVPAILLTYAVFWAEVGADIGLANNNLLVFLLIALFAAAHMDRRHRVAGILLGLAIGTKIWPVLILILILRERRWTEVKWTAYALSLQGLLVVLWLGPDALPKMADAILFNTARDLGVATVLWTTAFRVWWDWWPVWGGYLVALLLIALPTRGRLGLGLAILAGLSLNANLWHHYIWSFVLAAALIGASINWREAAAYVRRLVRPRPAAAPQTS